MDLEQLKQLVAAKLTCDQILDIIGWDTYDLVEFLQDELVVFQEEFEQATND